MVKVIDGKDTVLGRLATYVSKEATRGEDVVVLNCDQVIITGDKENLKKQIEDRRKRIGSGQQGPKISRSMDRIVKRAIRGMLPNHREGRGKVAYKKIKCFVGVPKEFQDIEKITLPKKRKKKFVYIKDIPGIKK